MGSSIEITPELLAGFLDEAPEYLDMLDVGLMELESKAGSGVLSLDAPEDQEQMNTMFRAAHSLKGLAAACGFDKIKELTHRIETLFDHVRMRKRDLSAESFEVLFQVFDRLKALVHELSEPTGAGADVEIGDILAALDRILGSPAFAAPAAKPAPTKVAEPRVENPAPPPPVTPQPSAAGAVQSEVLADPELAAVFVEATVEAVDEMTQGLLGLENDPTNAALLNTVFRCAHNVKGASGAVGFRGMNRLTHEMETVFDHLRNGRIVLNDVFMNTLFHTLDRLRAAAAAIKAGRFEDLPPAQVEDGVRELASHSAACAVQTDQRDVVVSSLDPSNLSGVPVTPAPAVCDGEGDGRWTVCVTFADGFSEAPIQAYLIFNKLNDIGSVHRSEPDLDSLAGDSIVKQVTFTVECDASGGDIEQAVRAYTVESVTVVAAMVQVDATPSGGSSKANAAAVSTTSAVSAAPVPSAPVLAAAAPAASQSMARETTKATATVPPVRTSANDSAAPPKKPTVAAKVAAGATSKADAAKPDAGQPKTTETLRVDQERLDQLMNLGGELVINRARFVQIHGRFRDVFDGRNLAYLVDDMTERVHRLGEQVDSLRKGSEGRREIDEINDHLGHLGHSFQSVRNVVQQVHELRTAMFDFDEALHGLTRVSDGIQKGIMGTRMVPIGPLFGRFKRVIRDVAKTCGKQIQLVLQGEHTELDKRMIDELGDPLTHMVRNSVDHGIETPDVRVAAGKDPTGTITLEASHRGNSICVVVSDDGQGVNLDRVKAKIIERELATPAQVEKMTDREIVSYVMKPGFSTAQTITDISGRGMGMDIVISKIEKLSGTVDIDSIPGKGSRVTIKLPLTLAILRSLVARIGKGVYAIPLETVAEIITVSRSQIQCVQRRQVVRIRERVIPVAAFEEIFGTSLPNLQTKTRENDELTLVIVGFENSKIGLVVDQLLGQEDVVIKSIAENYRNVKGIAGASIRGDGSVSLILDINAMMEMASRMERQAAVLATPTPVGA